jgi:hypothetical protein
MNFYRSVFKDVPSVKDSVLLVISMFFIIQIAAFLSLILPPASIFLLHILDYQNQAFEQFENKTNFKKQTLFTQGFRKAFYTSLFLCFIFWIPGVLFTYFIWFRFLFVKMFK